MDNFKISVKAARVNAGLTQKQAADRLGVNAATLSKYESENKVAKLEIVRKMCSLYQIPIEHIFLN